jgi:PAS domain-containing protein
MPLRNPRYDPQIKFSGFRAACSAAMTTPIRNRAPEPELTSNCTALFGVGGALLEASDGFCKLSGYSREELIAMKDGELIAPAASGAEKRRDAFTSTGQFRRLLAIGEARGNPNTCRVRISQAN